MNKILAATSGLVVSAFFLTACDNGQVSQKTVAPEDAKTQVTSSPPASSSPKIPAASPVEPLPHYNIHFAINSAELSPMGTEILGSTVAYLSDHPAAQVKLSGYTDSLGSTEANRRLAKRRVTKAAKFLEENGIAVTRITTVAVGEPESDLTPAGENPDTWNRRVEIEFAQPPNS